MNDQTCKQCKGSGVTRDIENNEWCCLNCFGWGDMRRAAGVIATSDGTKLQRVDPEGRLIRAAADVMRAQRAKGIAKYKSTLEDQNGYTIGGMIDMVAEELADGSVYVQKVREMYLALLAELEAALYIRAHDDADRSDTDRITDAMRIISRERGNV